MCGFKGLNAPQRQTFPCNTGYLVNNSSILNFTDKKGLSDEMQSSRSHSGKASHTNICFEKSNMGRNIYFSITRKYSKQCSVITARVHIYCH